MSSSFKDVKGGQTTVNGASQALSAFAVDPIAGDLVLVFQSSFFGSNPTHTAPTDNKGGNTYTQIGAVQRDSTVVEFTAWFSVLANGGSGFIVTAHQTNGTMGLVSVLITGNHGVPYNGDTAFQNTTGANPSSGTSSPAPALGSIFFGALTDGLGDNASANGSGWNTTGVNGFTAGMATAMRQSNNTSSQDLYVEYQMSDAALAAVWTAASSLYIARVASFKPGATAPAVIPNEPWPLAVQQRMG